MSGTITHDAVTYAEDKTAFLERHVEPWLAEHRQAEECSYWEHVANDVNRLLTDLFDLDSKLQDSYVHGVPYQPDLEKRIGNLIVRWVKLAERMRERGDEFDRKGYVVEGLDRLKANVAEAKATINPSQELNAAMSGLRDQAIVELEAGKSMTGIVD